MTKPTNRDQFRDTPREPMPYMGGTAMSCGQHPSLPKEHRWSKVRIFRTQRGEFRDRICLNCSLTKGADE